MFFFSIIFMKNNKNVLDFLQFWKDEKKNCDSSSFFSLTLETRLTSDYG